MALSNLVLIRNGFDNRAAELKAKDLVEEKRNQDFNELEEIGSTLDENNGQLDFLLGERVVSIRGIREDFKVYVDGRLAVEMVFGNPHNENEELLKILFD